MARTDRMFEGGGSPSGIGRGIARAEARALKAANAPVSKNNRDFGKGEGKANVRSAILSGKPANPNAVRGGSMKSQLNWPASMRSDNHQPRIGGHAN